MVNAVYYVIFQGFGLGDKKLLEAWMYQGREIYTARLSEGLEGELHCGGNLACWWLWP